ncbi:MAG: IPT/TIG domain-containing protein [Puniceicoccales bacterium]|jgi:hypothetical protein|nr:IPT/TIG domain-containing protein [Puniceicoccales bacterium]
MALIFLFAIARPGRYVSILRGGMFMKKFLSALAFLAALSGCAHTGGVVSHVDVVNTTPKTMAANASGTYPLTMRLKIKDGEVDKNSIDARIVIDGREMKMTRNGSSNEFIYDYVVTKDRNTATYYFDVNYKHRGSEGVREKNAKTDLYELAFSNRYVLGLDSVRGIPGTRIAILGRGFTKNDSVYVGGIQTETQFESPTTIRFFVPILPAGRTYPVSIEDDLGSVSAGEFRVDSGTLSVNPRAFDLRVGKSTTITLTTSMPATSGGLCVDITTNIPEAISVSEATIQEGRNSVNVTVTGVEPASGSLFVEIEGYKTVTIPAVIKQ